MAQPSIVVVGATGQLGMRLLTQLSAAGVKARALVRSREKARTVASIAVPVIGDLLKPDTLTAAFEGVEHVFVVAPPTADMETLELNAISAAVHARAKRVVYLSNFTASPESQVTPMAIHGRHELLVGSLDLEWTVLGPTRYMTNLPFDWPSVVNDGLLLEAGGSGVMTCIDPDDVAAIAVKTLLEDGHQGQTYRLTSQDEFTAAELATLLSKFVGRDVRVPQDIGDPPTTGYFGLVASGAYWATDAAANVLGRAPRRYLEWLQDHADLILAA